TVALAIAADAITDKPVSSCTLVLPSDDGETDIISTGRIRTSSPTVQPLDDTFCVPYPENTLLCQGIGSQSRIRLPCQNNDPFGLIVEGSTCSAIPSKVDSPSATDDVI
ncbi:hypothetical protein, partial [Sansalvadorimonas verongulae]|uniref:hypothetical protein n=1 Tax=Sansalvadorimonas verongulae TaxID=2172824 RepID=UPI001E43C55E